MVNISKRITIPECIKDHPKAILHATLADLTFPEGLSEYARLHSHTTVTASATTSFLLYHIIIIWHFICSQKIKK